MVTHYTNGLGGTVCKARFNSSLAIARSAATRASVTCQRCLTQLEKKGK